MTMFDTKTVGIATTELKAVSTSAGVYRFVMSRPILDRDQEVIDAGALKWVTPGRMPVDIDHSMSVEKTVGSGAPAYEGADLVLRDFRFASTPLAQDVKSLVDEGHISRVSVSFTNAKRTKDAKGVVHITSGELLNCAIVAVPALREAHVERIKSLVGRGYGLTPADAKRLAADALIELARIDAEETLRVLDDTRQNRPGPKRAEVDRLLREAGF